MNISYSWLKEYINLNLTPQELGAALTQIGLEVGSIEEVETIKGGLKGIVIGEVLTCEQHPDSDHLSKTTVNLGDGVATPIVCGASNVAAGQKVVVATVGTTLYSGDQEFKIKKAKIRGEVSEGMICAEDEIGLGQSHDGIMVLPDSAVPGTPAATYFNIESDYVLEVDLTPNRIDSASHIGIARDLAAFLKQRSSEVAYTRPSVDAFQVQNTSLSIPVEVLNPEACPRYAGVTISGVEVKESPEWLQNKLKLIGLKPINNIVDVTNFVLFETGQPLHAFDAAEIEGGKVVVRTQDAGTKFVTLDGVERSLHENDLMICNTTSPMCIGGVFGGAQSGVKESTKNVFLESAWFDPVFIRKTARRHGLNTDASFRFERGTDPNGVIYALKRAALLIQETAGGVISSEIVDVYPQPVQPFAVSIQYKNVEKLIGVDLGVETIKSILGALEIQVVSETEAGLELQVPNYRVDVQREADVIEEILRIYGYNNILPTNHVNSTLQYAPKPNPEKIKNTISEMLVSGGYNEIWSNSLTKAAYYDESNGFDPNCTVQIFNPLSQDLNAMRQSLVFDGLEAISRNTNFQNPDLKLFELGNVYWKKAKEHAKNPLDQYNEGFHLALWITGDSEKESWTSKPRATSFFTLKSDVEKILRKLGFNLEKLNVVEVKNNILEDGIAYQRGDGKTLVELGFASAKICKQLDIDAPVFYADFDWDLLIKLSAQNKIAYTELPKFPAVRRDLALLVDEEVSFDQLKTIASKAERTLLRHVDIFDVYKGDKLPIGKKSYALSFILRDDEKTLNDKVIDKTMERLIAAFTREVGAQLR